MLDPYLGYKEVTLRGILLGIVITIVFMASNIYLGLKVGLTFASAIPAAVLSMAILRYAKNSNILENNLVQTQASASGTLSAVIFVLPSLLMIGYWQSFPFWQTALVCLSGGILGALFTIPLRRAMVVNSNLPFPEGIAAAEILKAGTVGIVANEKGEITQREHQETHVKEIVIGAGLASITTLLNSGLKLMSDSASFWFKSGQAIFQIPFGFSLALLGAGSLIGMSAGLAMLVGLFLTWGITVPILSTYYPQPEHADMVAYAKQLWSQKARFIGVGVIGIAAIWTMIGLIKPLIQSIQLSLSNNTQEEQNRTTQDMSAKSIIVMMCVVAVLLALTFYSFIAVMPISPYLAWGLVALITLLVFVIGFFISAACAYMSGLVGSSSSPVSSIGILTVVLFGFLLFMIGHQTHLTDQVQGTQFLTALTLFGASAVFAVATIATDNLQDLKTGYLVYASPKKQQWVLILGSIVGALVIAPVLELLYNAYGFAGAMPRAGMNPDQALAAPQALLMTTITQGIFAQNLQWHYILIGTLIGLGFIVLDFFLKRFNLSLPILAVGMGIYLPPTVTMPLFLGALLFWFAKRKTGSQAERKGALFASGLIVGESLTGVLLAMVIVFSVSRGGSDSPLAIELQHWSTIANWLGLVAFLAVMYIFYRRVR